MRCLRGILCGRQATPLEIIVVDDQPRDDDAIARARAAVPEIIVTKTHGRHGLGAAGNAGLAVTGGFGGSSYMHMEEIDLCWRTHAAGFRVL